MKHFKLHISAGFCLGAILSACAFEPTTEDAKKFGKAATTASKVIGDAEGLQKQLMLETEDNRQACSYFRHGSYQLGAKPRPSKIGMISDNAKSIKNLVKYAETMEKATDPKGLKNHREAANSLLGTTGRLTTLAGAGGTLIEPVTKFTLSGLVNAAEFRRRYRIRRIARSVHGSLKKMNQDIDESVSRDVSILNARLSEWEKSTKCVLEFSRNSRKDAHDLFIKFSREKRLYESRISNLNKSTELMEALLDAHEKLYREQAEFDDAMKEFTKQTNNLADLALAYQNSN